MKSSDIAPCGMNCRICYAQLRDKNACSGCRGNAASIFNYCAKCAIRNCEYFKTRGRKYCFDCPEFPCKRLKQLDRRYRNRYHMSMLENLALLRDEGVEKFIKREEERWHCTCGAQISCHWKKCQACGRELADQF